MIIACLGDSLTEGDYGVLEKSGTANVQKENYPYFLGQYLQAEVRNFGKRGYRSGQYLEHYKNGCVHIEGADVILIMLGTNGGQSDTEQTPDNLAYYALIDACRADAPQARIVLCTPPNATENPAYSNCGYADGVAKAVSFVRRVAAERSLDLIDVACCSDFTVDAESYMQPNDGLHFNRKGYETLARFIAERLTHILYA